jgi:acyl-CoA synthetase (AMP-forming)/AMP-acid ligase II
VLGETAERSALGHGTCVGRRFSGIQWRVIRITDDAITTIERAVPLPRGEIGELIVQGPVVTREYVTRSEANRMTKIVDGKRVWHRMGDVGYLDKEDRFWFCGRKVHRVLTRHGPLYPVPCESIVNTHERVFRSALVGVGEPGRKTPVIIIEIWPEYRPTSEAERVELKRQVVDLMQRHELTRQIEHVLLHPGLPVDVRHNSKINREQLAAWATGKLGSEPFAAGD